MATGGVTPASVDVVTPSASSIRAQKQAAHQQALLALGKSGELRQCGQPKLPEVQLSNFNCTLETNKRLQSSR